MNVRFIRTAVVILGLVLGAASFAQAEPSSLQIKFKFVVAGKIMEPGIYTVDLADGGKVLLTPEKGTAVELPQVKTLGRKKLSKTELAFEEMGSMMYLSEVWVPDKEGVKVGGADGAERRVTVSGKSR